MSSKWLPAKDKKETLGQVFSCKFCEISKGTFFYGTPLVAASGYTEHEHGLPSCNVINYNFLCLYSYSFIELLLLIASCKMCQDECTKLSSGVSYDIEIFQGILTHQPCSYHMETSHLIGKANQLTGLYLTGTVSIRFEYSSVDINITSIYIWDNVFKNGPSEICKAVFDKFYLVQS